MKIFYIFYEKLSKLLSRLRNSKKNTIVKTVTESQLVDTEEIIETSQLPLSFDDWYAKNLSNERKKICEILATFSDDALDLYKAGMYIFLQDKFPAQQSIVAHCFREVINPILRYDERKFKKQTIEAISNIEFLKVGSDDQKLIEQVVNDNWKNWLQTLFNERAKLKNLILDRRPEIKSVILTKPLDDETRQILENEIDHIVNMVKATKGQMEGVRHCGESLKIVSQNELEKHINNIEKYITNLEIPQFVKLQESIDVILEDANTKTD